MVEGALGEATTQGYEPPRNTQFGVFLDNRVGKLLELVEVFAGHALQIAGFSVIDSADHAVVRLLTSRADLARRLLTRHELPFVETDVLVVELAGPQTLTQLFSHLLAAEVNIHYAYPLLAQPHGRPAVAIHCDEPVTAIHVLRRKLFTLLAENDLGDNLNPGHPELGPCG